MAQDPREAIASVADHPGPMFSAYVSVNAALPENQERAYLVRLRDAMNDMGVPEELRRRVREYLEAETHPRARALALFAAEDGLFEVHRLPVDLPESFRWGDPYIAPLTLVVDEYEPYGAAVLDAERFRYFVVSPLAGFRELDDVHPSQPYPRGGADFEPASRRTEAHVHRFYNELAKLTRDLTFRTGVRYLILAGPKERTAEFRKALPNELEDRVVAEEHIDLGAPEGELLARLEAIRERAEHERERELLDEIRERGVRGVDETIVALQEENRIYHLAALWDLDAEIRWCDNNQLAILDITAKECPYCGQKTRVRSLTDVLVDLATARGARLDFMIGENENTDILRGEFGGLAGLTRF